MRTPSVPRPLGPRRVRRRVLLWIGGGLLGAFVLAYLALFSYQLVESQLGSFAPLAAVLLLGLLLALAGPWLLIRYRRPLQRLLFTGVHWLWVWLQSTGIPQRVAARFPRLVGFLRARLALTPTGLTLSFGLMATGALLWIVLELLVEVVIGSSTVGVDRRILSLVAILRTPQLDQVMYTVTFLGNARTIVVLATVAVLVALVAWRWRAALLLLAALAASEIFFGLLSLLAQRPRPPLEDARIVQGGFSFPSGQSALAATFYGTVAYLLIRSTRREGVKALLGVGAALLIFVIGVSRIYLGLHYPSDVLAGWAAGALWVALVLVAEQVWDGWAPGKRSRQRSGQIRPLSRARRAGTVAAAVVLLGAASVYLFTVYPTIPPPPTLPASAPTIIAPSAIASVVERQLPHSTEGLTGHPQEPISLVFVGTRVQLEGAFLAAGWTEAKPYGFGVLAGGVAAALTHQPDPAGPVTPSFLADQPNALAFSLPVGKTFAQRHHIRLWTTHVQISSGQPLWLATASFDQGFELAPSTFLPTHRIAPDIDTERAFVAASLERTGLVTSSLIIQLVPPESGHNFDGDPFHTNGQAVILQLS